MDAVIEQFLDFVREQGIEEIAVGSYDLVSAWALVDSKSSVASASPKGLHATLEQAVAKGIITLDDLRSTIADWKDRGRL